MKQHFDEYASLYDAWFMENPNVLLSEARLVALTLRGAGNILSIGCGSGLFEKILHDEFGIVITDGIEPSTDMAEIARRRGLNVTIATAEEADFGAGKYNTILFNGSPSYITDLRGVVAKAYEALPAGGRVVLIDVPKESGYGMMYNLAKALGTWDHPLLEGVFPPKPYPIELVKAANWRTRESGYHRRSRIPRPRLLADPDDPSAGVRRHRRRTSARKRQGRLCRRNRL